MTDILGAKGEDEEAKQKSQRTQKDVQENPAIFALILGRTLSLQAVPPPALITAQISQLLTIFQPIKPAMRVMRKQLPLCKHLNSITLPTIQELQFQPLDEGHLLTHSQVFKLRLIAEPGIHKTCWETDQSV